MSIQLTIYTLSINKVILEIQIEMCSATKKINKSIKNGRKAVFNVVATYNISTNIESTVGVQDNVESHLCNEWEYIIILVDYFIKHIDYRITS